MECYIPEKTDWKKWIELQTLQVSITVYIIIRKLKTTTYYKGVYLYGVKQIVK